MSELSMQDLVKTAEHAKEVGAKYLAVRIQMDDFPEDELIINRLANFDAKLAYYQKTYGDDLVHKHSPSVKIIGFLYAQDFEVIKRLFN